MPPVSTPTHCEYQNHHNIITGICNHHLSYGRLRKDSHRYVANEAIHRNVKSTSPASKLISKSFRSLDGNCIALFRLCDPLRRIFHPGLNNGMSENTSEQSFENLLSNLKRVLIRITKEEFPLSSQLLKILTSLSHMHLPFST